MYVETYYKGKYQYEHLSINNQGKVKNPLYGDDIVNTGVYAQMARKIKYVGFPDAFTNCVMPP